jgi:hypothetical protein
MPKDEDSGKPKNQILPLVITVLIFWVAAILWISFYPGD